MKPAYRYMILALVGFGIGTGIAYFQAQGEARRAAGVATTAAEVRAVESEPAVKAENSALNAAAEDVKDNEAPAADGDSMSADKAELVEPKAGDADAGMDHSKMDHANMDHDSMQGMDGMEHMDHDMSGMIKPGPVVAGSSFGGDFSLTDHNGQAVTNKSWPGKYKLVFFGFTNCPDICPQTMDKLTTTLQALGDRASQIQPLFITIDPKRDDQAALKAYMSHYYPTFVGLTGTDEQLQAVQTGYKVYAAKVAAEKGEDYTMAHSSYAYLMSPDDELLEIIKPDETADDAAKQIGARLK